MSLSSTAVPPELFGQYTPRQLALALSTRLLADTRNATHMIRDLSAKVAESKAAGLHGSPVPRLSPDFVAEVAAMSAAADQLRAHGEQYMAAMEDFTSRVLDMQSRYAQQATELRAALATIEGSPRG